MGNLLINNSSLLSNEVIIKIILGIGLGIAVLLFAGLIFLIRYLKKKTMENDIEIDPEKVEKFERQIKDLFRNEISLKIEGEAEYEKGGTRFGGVPDVPEDFEWPYFEAAIFDDDTVKPRPLNFLAQFDLEKLSVLDKDNLLPKKGVLSFFHLTNSDCWGEKMEDMKCVRVFWFEDCSALKPAAIPEDLNDGEIFPMLHIEAESKNSVIDYEDFTEIESVGNNEFENYDKACENLGYEFPENSSKLLGWAEVIQSNITHDFELISRSQSLSNREDYEKMKEEAAQATPMDWLLLSQLDTVEYGDFELMFGDCGRLYIYIRKEDLLARRFDKVFFTWQCG